MPMPQAHAVLSAKKKGCTDHDHDEADHAHEEEAAEAGQVALGDDAVEGGAAEDRRRAEEGGDHAGHARPMPT